MSRYEKAMYQKNIKDEQCGSTTAITQAHDAHRFLFLSIPTRVIRPTSAAAPYQDIAVDARPILPLHPPSDTI